MQEFRRQFKLSYAVIKSHLNFSMAHKQKRSVLTRITCSSEWDSMRFTDIFFQGSKLKEQP